MPAAAPKLEPRASTTPPTCPARSTSPATSTSTSWPGARTTCGSSTPASAACARSIRPQLHPALAAALRSGLAPEDRCHLNGLAMVDGQPKYVTALGETDTPGGWRANKRSGGVLMDVERNEVLLQGLSMPHSPRLWAGRLWLLESGQGSLAYADCRTRPGIPWPPCPASRGASISPGRWPSSGCRRCARPPCSAASPWWSGWGSASAACGW